MAGQVWSCGADEEIETALDVMRTHQVHRLPIVDQNERLAGVLSFSDIVRHATQDAKIRSLGDHDLVVAYRTIKSPRVGEEADSAFGEVLGS
jgi:CBS-domain-containing membrane protein